MDPALIGLIGAVSGAAITGVIQLALHVAGDRTEHNRWKRDKRVEAYINFRLHLDRFWMLERSHAELDDGADEVLKVKRHQAEVTFYFPELEKQALQLTANVLLIREDDEEKADKRATEIREAMQEMDTIVHRKLGLA